MNILFGAANQLTGNSIGKQLAPLTGNNQF